ncbi:MAG TPA: arsenate reductase ArsC [Rhodanobacteraceae bacterium]|nr:arsenate reductase ArsC [Rhodanobacteraceae bacterium]
MNSRPYNVLFLCTANSARSVMAEALLNVLGGERFSAFSAGNFPTGTVQPVAAELARDFGYAGPLRSKSRDEFALPDSPPMDMVITVCDNAAGEVCPVWPGGPATAHWSIPDPAAASGSDNERRRAFRSVWMMLRRRIELLLALPIDRLDRLTLQRAVRELGQAKPVDAR